MHRRGVLYLQKEITRVVRTNGGFLSFVLISFFFSPLFPTNPPYATRLPAIENRHVCSPTRPSYHTS